MGAECLLDVLKKIDLAKLAADLRKESVDATGQRKVKITKQLRVVESMRKAEINPSWTILTILPVIPPDLRPMVQLTGGKFATSDLNDLYRRVINRNNRLKHHGYWYGIVASNEFEEAWLDEGINSYSEVKAMERYYGEGRSMIDLCGLKIGDIIFQRLRVIGSGRLDPILQDSWKYVSGSSYGTNVYAKAALMMLTLERWLGEDVMARVMKAYYERWKFRHPASEDFVRVAEEESGRDLGWFFGQVLRTPGRLDYAVSELSADEIDETRGLFDDGKGGPVAEGKAGRERRRRSGRGPTATSSSSPGTEIGSFPRSSS